MNWFRNLPLRNKMVVLVLGITAITLLLSGGLWIYFDLEDFKKDRMQHWSILAGTVGRNARVAVMFGDQKSAEGILSSLKRDPQILSAALFDSEGREIAHYIQEQAGNYRPPTSRDLGSHLFPDHVEILEPITMKTDQVGTIYLHSSLAEIGQRLVNNVFILTVIWAATLGVAFLLIWKIQALVTQPILTLAETVMQLSRKPDYAVRVPYESDDEIGVLCRGFNTMIRQLEIREKELTEYRDHLEDQVQQRTADLRKTNVQLVHEINERQRTENRLQVSLKEKEILLKEINHRTKNNMQILSSLLWLQSQDIQDPDVAEKFRECTQRIRAMALVHEKIFNAPDLTGIEFGDYLQSLFQEQLHSFGITADRISFHPETDHLVLALNPGMYLGLIINELISNSLKHAFPDHRNGEIRLSLKLAEDNCFELIYTDDGIGLPEHFEHNRSRTLGFRLIQQLVEHQLNGELIFQSRNPLVIIIRFHKSGEE